MNRSAQRSWIRETLSAHPGLLISPLYLVASLIGLAYSWLFLREFGINVLLYAELSDFLLASLKEPPTWLLTLFAFGLVVLDNTMSRKLHQREPGRWLRWYGSRLYRQANYLVLFILVLVFMDLFATTQEKKIRSGNGETVGIQLADGSPAQELVLLGTTVRFIFLYDAASERVVGHPFENVLTITGQAAGEEK